MNADGEFIHHRSSVSDDENMRLMFAYRNGTLARYQEYFGTPPIQFLKDSKTAACSYC